MVQNRENEQKTTNTYSDEFDTFDTVDHVETDVNLDVGLFIGQFDNRDLERKQIWIENRRRKNNQNKM